jgi:hypothetical protein
VLDFNPTEPCPLNERLNQLIDLVRPREENSRQYLGASSIGSECLRQVQYEWMCDVSHSGRLRDIFERGHYFEEQSRRHLIAAGFQFAPAERLAFSAMDNLFRGHADGVLTGGPQLPGLIYPALWEHKATSAKNWRAIKRDGLAKGFLKYAAQVVTYQSCLKLKNPALFTVLNADTCERFHLLVPYCATAAKCWIGRAETVIEATRAGELLPRFTDDPGDWRCKMCGHFERCWRS